MRTYLFLPVAAVLLLAACKKDDPEAGLPAATQEGKNTAGFLVNGEAWLPKASAVGNNPYTVSASYGPYLYRAHLLAMSMYRYQDVDHSQSLTLYLAGVRRPGTYQLNQDINTVVISKPLPSHAMYNVSAPGPDSNFYTSASAHGQVVITRLDTVARIVAGTFEAKLKEDGGPDSLSLTQGRFDIKY